METFTLYTQPQYKKPHESAFTLKNVFLFLLAMIVAISIWYFYDLYSKSTAPTIITDSENPFDKDITGNPFTSQLNDTQVNPLGQEAPINPFDQFDREENLDPEAYQNPF